MLFSTVFSNTDKPALYREYDDNIILWNADFAKDKNFFSANSEELKLEQKIVFGNQINLEVIAN